MRTVYIMVEGPTEEEFVNNCLAAYLQSFGINNAVPILLETSPGFYGGDITFSRYQANARNLLAADPAAIVTSLIDFYELKNDFPGFATAMAMQNKMDAVTHIEQEIHNVIVSKRFIPYIQLHEFEGLLFADIKGFQTYFPAIVNHAQFIINHNPNPEMINDSPLTAPSVRLKGIFSKVSKRYQKKFHGPIIALENGITPLLQKCTRFKEWTDLIVVKATAP